MSHVRLADRTELPAVGQLLHDFNREFDEPAPQPDVIARRLAELLDDDDDDATVIVGGDGPDGVAVLQFRKSIWTPNLECYVAELYVVPGRRGKGLGRTIMTWVLAHARERGADFIDLVTSEHDVAACHLYESCGFTRFEGGEGGPAMYSYQQDL